MRFSPILLLLSCGGTTPPFVDGGDGGSDGTAQDSIADTQMDSSGGDCKAPPINLTFAGCPTTPTCGGMIADGLYYYTSGCISDPWAAAKQNCMMLTVSEEKGTVRGCATFASGTVTRNVTATYSAKLDLPVTCTLGQPCSTVEGILKPYFTTASCMGTVMTGCTCTVSLTTSSTASAGYTTMNNQIVTTAGGHYDYCGAGKDIGIKWNSGGTMEPGTYTVTKQ